MFACPSHSCTLAISALWARALVAQGGFCNPHMQEPNILLFFKQLMLKYGRYSGDEVTDGGSNRTAPGMEPWAAGALFSDD
jgi:hypothetical protein